MPAATCGRRRFWSERRMWLALFSTVIFALDRDSRRWKLPKTVFFSCSVSSLAALLEEMLGKIGEEKRRGGEDRLKVKQRGVSFMLSRRWSLVSMRFGFSDSQRMAPMCCFPLLRRMPFNERGLRVRFLYSSSVKPNCRDSVLTLRSCLSIWLHSPCSQTFPRYPCESG